MFQVVLNSFLDIDMGAESVLIAIIDNDASGKIALCASVFVQELNLFNVRVSLRNAWAGNAHASTYLK